jgi:hypothetical protein
MAPDMEAHFPFISCDTAMQWHWLSFLYVGRKATKNFSPWNESFLTDNPQPLTEMCTGSRQILYLGSRVLPVRSADNLTAIFEPTV